jgi:hypothetical protein
MAKRSFWRRLWDGIKRYPREVAAALGTLVLALVGLTLWNKRRKIEKKISHLRRETHQEALDALGQERLDKAIGDINPKEFDDGRSLSDYLGDKLDGAGRRDEPDP